MKRTPLKRNQTPLRRTPLKKTGSSLKRTSFNKISPEEKQEMRELFLQIWDEREDEQGFCYCFETGKPMHRNTYRELSSCYDHVLEKEPYPQYTLVKRNLIIILPDVHHQKGTNINFTPKIKKYREELLNLHGQNKLNDG